MKNFYHIRYRFYKPGQKEHKILAISDVHFSEKTAENLTHLAEKAEQIQPQLITISGDLVDSLSSIDSSHEAKRLEAWLKRLGKVAPVILCLGNHDFYRKAENFHTSFSKERGFFIDSPDPLIKLVNGIENVHLLNDEAYENHDFYVYSLTLPPNYYCYDKKVNPIDEDANILINKLDEASSKFAKLPKHKTKIILVHSPAHLTDERAKPALENFDFVIAGHMHNGVVPPLLNEVWRGHHGIVTPGKRFFQDYNTRIDLYGDRLIVLGAVTTIQAGAKPFSWLNGAYPVNIATIETSHNETIARKPDIHKKYEKWSNHEKSS